MNKETLLNPYKDYDEAKLFQFYKRFKPYRKPGEKYEYSNLAMGTLGVILERVYKKAYETLFMDIICHPLGMNDTRQFISKYDSSKFATGYNENGSYTPPWDFDALAGAGAIRSTAADLIKYAEANLGEAPLQLKKDLELTHQKTYTGKEISLGLAWHYIKPGSQKVLFHNGGTGGYRSYLAFSVPEKYGVVVLSNSSISVDEVGNNLMKWLEENEGIEDF